MSRGRRRIVGALVVLGSILAFFSVVAIWVERQALNTDDWVGTSQELIADERIRTAVADYLVDQLYENVDIEKELEGKLPGDFKDLAGPISGGARQFAGEGAEKVLETSTAQSLWEEANRAAHEQLLAVLEDEGEAISTEEGDVTLNLGALITNLADQIGIGQNLADQLDPDFGQVEILHSDELQTAQDIAVAIKGLALVLSILTFAAFAAAMYLSRPTRWMTVLFSGVGLIAAGFAVIVVRQIAGGIVVDQLVTTESVKPAGEAAWSIGTSLMVSIATTVIVVGILFAVAGWLASPNRTARSTRRAIAPALQRYNVWVYSGLAIVVGIYFLAGPTQGLRTLITTLIVAGMAAFGIHELRKLTAEEFPDAKFSDTFGASRDKLVSAVRGANLGERAAKLRLPERRRPTPPPAPPVTEAATEVIDEEDTRLERLEKLAALRDRGILTEEEFAAEKARVLGGPDAP
jgi:hypothetical protein